jgi:hypothetical protein
MSSVQLKEQVTRTQQVSGNAVEKGHEGIAHEIGEALTKGGGPNGYLAVCFQPETRELCRENLTGACKRAIIGLLEATPIQSDAHEDADVGHTRRLARIPRIMDRP